MKASKKTTLLRNNGGKEKQEDYLTVHLLHTFTNNIGRTLLELPQNKIATLMNVLCVECFYLYLNVIFFQFLWVDPTSPPLIRSRFRIQILTMGHDRLCYRYVGNL